MGVARAEIWESRSVVKHRRKAKIPDTDQIAQLVDAVPFWWHSIDLGHGIVTPGARSLDSLLGVWDSLSVPNLAGKAVLDIGAWDGFFSFEAERRGAARVVALDHYVWSLDLAGQQEYWARCRDEGRAPQPYHETAFWQPGALPGKRGFDAAHRARASRVESVVDDYAAGDPRRFGSFDVVFYLGVLYHMEDPLAAMRNVFALTKELLILETEAVALPTYEHVPMFEFYPGAELNHDVSNWWGPNLAGVHAMCRAAGFAEVTTIRGAPPDAADRPTPLHYRAIVHARKRPS
jgi:tRNA (mo5U34)-methyltransferase